LEHLAGEGACAGVKVLKLEQSDEALCGGMDIEGINAVVKVGGRAVGGKEVVAIEAITARERFGELERGGVAANTAQGAEVVAGVEIVFPPLGRLVQFAVVPGAVGVLFGDREASALESGFKELLIPGHAGDAAEKGGAEEVGVMDLGAGVRKVAEARGRASVLVVEVIEEEASGADGGIEAAGLRMEFVVVEEGVAGKRGADDVGRAQRNEENAGLPVEVVAPGVMGSLA
jgi:hypothetical protein